MKVQINGQEIELKQTFRSLIIYENIMDKSFSPVGATEIIVYFYCVILASNKDIQLQYEDYLDWLDSNPDILTDFSQWLTDISTQQAHIKKN